ncbi:MAG: hypothetical protein NZ942_03410 [Candidatus Aenigmarchaeota archaeon]|nr:hypothetical protein [Candidatus Aenigmarchaeota archaeon]
MKALILVLVLIMIVFSVVYVHAADVYVFSQYADVENSKANEYIAFKAKEFLAGVGFTTNVLTKNDKLEMKAGLGRSKANIDILQSVNVLGKVYQIEKDLNYNTGMYLVSTSYSYRFSKDFSVQFEVEKSKNLLERKQYILKLKYEF